MTGPRIDVSGGVPDEVREAIEPHLERWAPVVLPAWVDLVEVMDYEQTDDENDTLEVDVMPEYRYVQVYVRPRFLKLTFERREETVLHELAHATIEPLAVVLSDVIQSHYEEDEPVRKVLEETARRAWEGATEDLTQIVGRVYEAGLTEGLFRRSQVRELSMVEVAGA